MPALNFPDSPSLNDVYTDDAGRNWVCIATSPAVWDIQLYQKSDSWGAPKTSNYNLVPLSQTQVDLSSGAITATLPTVLQIGDSFTVSCFDSTSSGNLLTIARNGNNILDAEGKDINSDLDVAAGNAVQLVVETATDVRIVG